MRSRKEKTILRIVALALSVFTVANSAFSVYAYYGVPGRIMCEVPENELDQELLKRDNNIDIDTSVLEDKQTITEGNDAIVIDDQTPVETDAGTPTPDNENKIEGDMSDIESTSDDTPIVTENTDDEQSSETINSAVITSKTLRSVMPTALPQSEVIGKLTADSDGNISGVNLTMLAVQLSFANAEVLADDTFSLKIESKDGEFSGLSAGNLSVSGSGSSYTISGIGKDTNNFTIDGLDKKEFSMYVVADSDNKTELSFSYDASVESGEDSVFASLSISVTAKEKENSDDSEKNTDDEEKTKDFTGSDLVINSVPDISSASAVLKGDGINADAKFVIKNANSGEDNFKSYIENSEFTLVDDSLYVFDMQFEKDGKYLSVNQDVEVGLKFSPALFAEVDADYYLVLHEGDELPLAKLASSAQGLPEVSFTTSSFSNYAIAAVKMEENEGEEIDTDRDPKVFDMDEQGWIKDSHVFKKVGNDYIPIGNPEIVLQNGDQLKVTIDYQISALASQSNVTFVLGDAMTYIIPEYLYDLKADASGKVMDGEMVAGSYNIDSETRTLTIKFDDQDYIDYTKGKISKGMITFEGKLDTTKIQDEDGKVTILFSEAKCNVSLEPEKKEIKTAFEIIKTHDASKDRDDALAYTITVTAKATDPQETYTEVQIEDKFISGSDVVTYDQTAFPNVSLSFDEKSKSFVWIIGEMKSGETKEITYWVKYDTDKINNTTLKNTATLTVKELTGELKSTVTVVGNSKVNWSKSVVPQEFTSEGKTITGKYNWVDHTVKYQIEVSAPESNAFAVNDVVIKDVFKDTDGSNAYVLNDYTFDPANATIQNKSTAGFDWVVGTLNPGETKTLTYTVKLIDFSNQGQLAYQNGQLDIWYRNSSKRNPSYNLDNGATLWIGEKKEDGEKTASVTFSKVFVWKDTTHTKVNTANKTITFEIHANEPSKTGAEVNVPAFDITGWKFRDWITNGWMYTGELKVYAFDAFQEGVGSANPVLTYQFIDSAKCDNFTFTNATNDQGTSEFIFTVPNDARVKNKYLILIYDVKLIDESKWGTINYNNSISLGVGTGGALTPPQSGANGSASFGGGIEKKFVERDGDMLYWQNTVKADVKESSTVYDWLDSYQIFSADDMNLVIKQGDKLLTKDVDYKVSIAERNFTVTFLKDINSNATPITLQYSSRIDHSNASLKAYGTYNLNNYAKLTVNYNGTTLTDQSKATYTYSHYQDIKKDAMGSLTADGCLEWDIVLNKSGAMTSAIIEEIAPEGTVIDKESIKIYNKGWNAKNPQMDVTLSEDGTRATIRVDGMNPTLQADAWIKIRVRTKIVDDSFWTGEYVSTAREFVNKVILKDEAGGEDQEATAKHSVKYSPISKSGAYDSKTGELSYTIVVNPNSNDLLQNESTITLIDKMDPAITVARDTLVVKGNNGQPLDISGSVNYAPVGIENGFAITIPDDQKITITYKAQINAAIGSKLSVTNSAYFYGKSVETKPVESKIEFYVQTSGVTVQSDKLIIHKTTSDNSKVLEGAEFKVYTVGENGALSLDQIVTTGADGNAVINGLIAGKLYAYEETKSPAGYMFVGGDIHYFWVSESEKTEKPVIPSGISESKVETYQFGASINVNNDRPGIAVIKAGEGGEKLAGAEFTLYKGEEVVSTAVTDSNGLAIFKDLDAGSSYRLVETKAPVNYAKYDGEYLITINKSGYIKVTENGSSELITVSIGDAVVSGQISYPSVIITNKKEKGTAEFFVTKKLTGREWLDTDAYDFVLKAVSENAPMPAGTSGNSKQITVNAKTAGYTLGFGEITFSENGEYEYSIEEVVPEKDDGIIYSTLKAYVKVVVASGENGSKVITIYEKESENGSYSEVKEASLNVLFENHAVTGAIKLIKKDSEDGSKLLPGAEFELYRIADANGTGEGIRYPSESVTYTTDENGEIVVTQLPLGTYYFKEILPPEGYQLGENLESNKVTLTKENAEATVNNPLTVEVTNKKLSGVVLQKTGPNGEELAGAEFELYKADGTLIGNYTTGSNGIIKVEKRLAEGEYYFIETKAPEGYLITLDNNGAALKYAFTVDGEHNSVVGIDLGKIENRTVPTPTPTPTPTSTPGTTPTPTPETTPTPGTTITPGTTPGNPPEGEVLGASRVPEGGAVLGARRGSDYAVLGKRRRPSTGDSMALIIWIIVLSAAAGGALTAGMMLYIGKKNKKE